MNTTAREVREIVRDEPVVRGRILDLLTIEPRTIPEIASAIDRPTHEVVFWIMAMRRYGWLREIKGADADGYFRYEPTGRTS